MEAAGLRYAERALGVGHRAWSLGRRAGHSRLHRRQRLQAQVPGVARCRACVIEALEDPATELPPSKRLVCDYGAEFSRGVSVVSWVVRRGSGPTFFGRQVRRYVDYQHFTGKYSSGANCGTPLCRRPAAPSLGTAGLDRFNCSGAQGFQTVRLSAHSDRATGDPWLNTVGI